MTPCCLPVAVALVTLAAEPATTRSAEATTTTRPATQPLLAQDAPPREGPESPLWWIDRCYAELRALEIPRREDRGRIGEGATAAQRERERREAGRPEPDGHLMMLQVVAKVQRLASDDAGLARTEAWARELRQLNDPSDAADAKLYETWADTPGGPRAKAKAVLAATTQPKQRQDALRMVVHLLANTDERAAAARGGPVDLVTARELLREIEHQPTRDRLALTLVKACVDTGDLDQAAALLREITLPPDEMRSRHDVLGALALAQAKAGRATELDLTLPRLRAIAQAELDAKQDSDPVEILVMIHNAERAAGRAGDAEATLARARELALAMNVDTPGGQALERLFGALVASADGAAATDRLIAAAPRNRAPKHLDWPGDAVLYSIAVSGQAKAGQFDAARRTWARMRELGIPAETLDGAGRTIARELVRAGRFEDVPDVLRQIGDPALRWEALKGFADETTDDARSAALARIADALPPPAGPVQRLRAAQVYLAAGQTDRAAALLRELAGDIRAGQDVPKVYPGEILLAMRQAGALDAAAETARRLSPAHLPAIARAYARAGDLAAAKALVAERLAQLDALPAEKRSPSHAVALAAAAGAVGDRALFDRLIPAGNEAALKSNVQLWGGETGTWEPLCDAYHAAGRMKDFAAVVDRIGPRPARAIVNLVAAQELLGTDIFNPSEIPEP